jgi:S-formylglutathione hydrolase FrmB
MAELLQILSPASVVSTGSYKSAGDVRGGEQDRSAICGFFKDGTGALNCSIDSQ